MKSLLPSNWDELKKNVVLPDPHAHRWVQSGLEGGKIHSHGGPSVTITEPNVEKDGPRKSVVTNFAQICLDVGRSEAAVMDFFFKELSTTGNLDGKGCLLLKGTYKKDAIEKVLRKYLKGYVLCHQCQSAQTLLEKDPKTRLLELKCTRCHSTRNLKSTASAGFVTQTTRRVSDTNGPRDDGGSTPAATEGTRQAVPDLRFYQKTFPDVDDLVMVRVDNIEEHMAVYVTLLEYENMVGMVLLTEITRQRMRSMSQHIKVGSHEVMVVTSVDKTRGNINLSKVKVPVADRKQYEERFARAKTVHGIIQSAALMTSFTMERLSEDIVWPMYRVYGEAYEGIKLAFTDPAVVMAAIGVSAETRPLFEAVCHQRYHQRIKVSALRICAEIDVTLATAEGVEGVKELLSRAEKECSTDTMPLKVSVVGAPLYAVQTHTMDQAEGLAVVGRAVQRITEWMNQKGGECILHQGFPKVYLDEVVKEKLTTTSTMSKSENNTKKVALPPVDPPTLNTTLNTSSPEVIRHQATVSVGIIGHVAHGKSTIVKALCGVVTGRHMQELKENKTIKLGYANAKIYQCMGCPRPECYQSHPSKTDEATVKCRHCKGHMTLRRHVSFVDCPGHDVLMATMLNGVAVMDAAILLVAANEECPQPQTREHLSAIEMARLRNILVLQNKIDLVTYEAACSNRDEIARFVQGTPAGLNEVIPVSAQLGINVDVVCEMLCNERIIPPPSHASYTAPARMVIVRSFDVNKPGTELGDMKGGVAGGTLTQGVLRMGQEIEVRPGVCCGSMWRPIRGRVVSLCAEENQLDFAVPGGLIGVGTTLDPAFTRADRLVGQVLGDVGSLPDVFDVITISYHVLDSYVGLKDGSARSSGLRLHQGEADLQINLGAMSTHVRVVSVTKSTPTPKGTEEDGEGDVPCVAIATLAVLKGDIPVCASVRDKLTLSRKVGKSYRLLGWGCIQSGHSVVEKP